MMHAARTLGDKNSCSSVMGTYTLNCGVPECLGNAAGAVDTSTMEEPLLQEAGRLEPDNETGTTPLRTAQPTPTNTPIGAIAGALSRPVAGVHHQ